MPAQAEANNLFLDDVPEVLKDMCPAELRISSQRLPFMQIYSKPRGGQKGIKGAVVNVPSRLDNIVKTHPRMPTDCGLVPVKLKKKLEYKGHTMYQSIRPEVVMQALKTLKECNPLYQDVDVDEDWLQKCKDDEEELCRALIEAEDQLTNPDESDLSEAEEEPTDSKKDDDEEDSNNNADKLREIPYNTCPQPASELPDNSIISLAPGEGEHLISLLTDNQCEVLAFPSMFPTGRFGHFDPSRPVKLSPKRYFNQRLLNVDRRFACNIEYLFFAQYFTELKQVLDNISIAVRLLKPGQKTAAAVRGSIENMMRDNDAYKFLQTVRGSHPYWKRTLHDLCAMVRQLDIPTWFLTLSAADLMWPEPTQIIASQQGVHLTDEDFHNLSWQEKCKWIQSNPVTAARVFDHRAQKFIHGVLMSEAKPIGEIVDYFYRAEFQQRGSPHLHCLFWVKDAPKLNHDSQEDICSVIDRYISGTVPDIDLDQELHALVDKVQRHTHSAACTKSGKGCHFHFPKPVQRHTHSAACTKSGKGCRFYFPKPPTSETLIADVANIESDDPAHIKMRKEYNADILKKVYDCLAYNPDMTFDELLQNAEVDPDTYLTALRESTSSPTVILARQPADTFVNNYSPDVLLISQANMDIQYVSDPYACAMYILSYITKAEKQMGELLKWAAEQCKEDDSVRQQMKTVGNVFLTHREVSAQEAGYRIIPIALKKSSRVVVFVNTSMPPDRIRILKPQSQLKDLPDNSTNIYVIGILEWYMARPKSLEIVCLADFATSYRLASTSASEGEQQGDLESDEEEEEIVTSSKIQLQQGLGMMYKRRRRAVLRTPRFSRIKQPEKFFHSTLMLYKPWRNEEELLDGFESYEDHFEAVKDTLEEIIRTFESDDGLMDEALKVLQTESPPTQAWDNLAPEEQQEEEDDCREGAKPCDEHQHIDPGSLQQPPELSDNSSMGYSIQNQTDVLPTEQFQTLVQSLNSEQRQIFNMIQCWCQQVVQARKTGDPPAPFYTFVTGGAGTGKSHLIKAVLNMARKELRPICDSDDEATVLIAAPTGIAAINVEGGTIHSIFSIPHNTFGKSDVLSQDKKATMRTALRNLKIVILDEVSMVGYTRLIQIHQRLQEIMGTTRDDIYFGGVSVLAVGDFYQIDPVKSRAVYKNPGDSYEALNPFHLWKDLFRIAELHQIMRQKDDVEFAEMLNRVRTGQLTDHDTDVLKERIITPDDPQYPSDALHVFPTNAQVDTHNKEMIAKLNTPLRHLHAIDSRKDLQTGKASITIPDNPADTGCLREVVSLCEGCRVMITKNICIEDNLVNGIQRTVVGFMDNKDKSSHQPVAVLIKFDHPDVGKLQRKKFLVSSTEGATPITPLEARFSVGKYKAVDVTRTQFPLTPAFACTIHKVHGLSLDKVVVSIQSAHQPGQAYVAMSRARTLQGLHLLDFDVRRIKTSPAVDREMNRLRSSMPLTIKISPASMSDSESFKVCHINCRSLVKHIEDVRHHQDLLSCHVICVTETWLARGHSSDNFSIPGFTMFRQDRQDSYSFHMCPPLDAQTCNKCNSKGGLAVYIRDGITISDLPAGVSKTTTGFEIMTVAVEAEIVGKVKIVLVYRPQHIPLQDMYIMLSHRVQKIQDAGYHSIILGDFNEDLRKSSTHGNSALTSLGLQQLIDQPTHMYGSLLDHIYTNLPLENTIAGILPSYYSDHNAVFMAYSSSGENGLKGKKISLCQPPKETKCHPGPSTSKDNSTKTRKTTFPNVKSTRSTSKDPVLVLLQVQPPSLVVKKLEPPTDEDRQSVANFFGVQVHHDGAINPELYDHRYTAITRSSQQQTPNSQIDMIEPDGNCFFRSISKEVLGTQKFHSKIRKSLCDFMSNHPNTFQNWFEGGADGFTKHIQDTRRARVWATELEIIAAATFFNTSIYQFTKEYIENHDFSQKWVRFKPHQLSTEDPPYDGCSIEGKLYLHHTWGVHYNRVFSLPQGSLSAA